MAQPENQDQKDIEMDLVQQAQILENQYLDPELKKLLLDGNKGDDLLSFIDTEDPDSRSDQMLSRLRNIFN
jgi:hypothetical protein